MLFWSGRIDVWEGRAPSRPFVMWRGGHFGRLVCSIASSIEYCNPQSQQSLTFFVIFVTRNHHVLFDDFIAERSEVKSHTPFDTHSVHPLSPVHLYLFIDVEAKYRCGVRLLCPVRTREGFADQSLSFGKSAGISRPKYQQDITSLLINVLSTDLLSPVYNSCCDKFVDIC